MIAKIICHGPTRAEAIAIMRRALEECVIDGVHTTLEFHQAILRDKAFLDADFSTRFLDDFDWGGK
jgi:acetyl-CoA carboxylase biotin carboxylase subunit